MSLLHMYLHVEEDQMETEKWLQDHTLNFQTPTGPRPENSVVRGEILTTFKQFIQAFMHVLNTCKNE